MGREGDMVAESWLSSLWKNSWKSPPEPEKATVGILAFELVGLMSKLVNLWNSLSDKEVARLREEFVNLLGVKKLVSEDDEFVMDLVLDELIENLGYVAKSVARLGKRCADPVFYRVEEFLMDPVEKGCEWYGWAYKPKKMDRKVKKMERLIAATLQLHQELDVLAELEQTLRRMQSYAEVDKIKLLEFQQKVLWQRQEVKHLREMSPWYRSYDYTVRILLRSLFTILERIKHVFGATSESESVKVKSVSKQTNADCLPRSRSFSSLMQSSVHPSENNLCGFYSGPLGKSVSKSKFRQAYDQTFILRSKSKNLHSKTKRLALAHVGPFKGCMVSGNDSPILQNRRPTIGGSMRSTSIHSNLFETMGESNNDRVITKLTLLNLNGRLSNALPNTLGDAALCLHYANIILLIEKHSATPHLVGLDARDDLYNRLPVTLKTALRGRLKLYAKTLASAVYDAALAAEWSLALSRILEWLGPIAHNTIRWHSERNYEKQNMSSGSNVLLVQTLYYANQAKAEAAIAELLMGLNYVCRFGREQNQKAWLDSAKKRANNRG